MNRSRSAAIRTSLWLSSLLLLVAPTSTRALVERQEPSRFDPIAIADPSVAVAAATVSASDASVPLAARSGWSAFAQAYGGSWDITLDARSGAPTLVQGVGIPFIPGSGNTLSAAQAPTLESIESSLRAFIGAHATLLHARDEELVLSKDGSGQITPDLWKVSFERTVAGVPVEGDRYIFYIGHGNLIAFGATRWSEIAKSAVPSITFEEARAD